MKLSVRFLCATFGIAVAVGSVIFMQSLVASNDAQAPAVARRLTAPWSAWRVDGVRVGPRGGFGRPKMAEHPPAHRDTRGPRPDLSLRCLAMQIDYRPDGHVLQGPPMTGVVAEAPAASPYASAPLAEGRWVDESSDVRELVCTYGTLKRFGRGKPAPLGARIKFIGEKGAVEYTIVGYLDAEKLPREWPSAFANKAGFAALHAEKLGTASFWKVAPADAPAGLQTADDIAPQFTSEAGRNMNRAKPLLLWAAALTALCLLLNTLLLTVQSRRHEIAVLRMVGLTRGGVACRVLRESTVLMACGLVLGTVLALVALKVYTTFETELFPMGMAVSVKTLIAVLVLSVVVALGAALLALRPALAVRPLEAASVQPVRRRTVGMLVAFACGFGAFVAVEVWGTSLTKPFIPSKQWPDAIVSILPAGVSSFDLEKLKSLPGVQRIAELQPLQVNFDPPEEMKAKGGKFGGMGMKQYRNALLLASDYLPPFAFVQGDRASAEAAIKSGDACIITEMMARARHLKLGDTLRLDAGRGLKIGLKIVGVVDLNWHMVTSRALVRGLNRMPSNTDGPAFVSFDTLAACDPRPQDFVNMTHVWLDYTPDFLAQHGVFEAGRKVEREIVAALNGANRVTREGDVRGNTVRLHARDEIADGTLAHSNDLVGAMARVPFIFLAVISLGFISMLIAVAEARKSDFVILRAVGATPFQLTAQLVRESLRTALGGIAFGLPGGALVGWLFTHGTRAAMSNWGLPPCFDIPLTLIFEGAFGAVVLALLIAIPTARAIIRGHATTLALPN